MRELLEQGFEVAVLGDGCQAALINFGYMANAVLSTDEVVKAICATSYEFATHRYNTD